MKHEASHALFSPKMNALITIKIYGEA